MTLQTETIKWHVGNRPRTDSAWYLVTRYGAWTEFGFYDTDAEHLWVNFKDHPIDVTAWAILPPPCKKEPE